MWVVSDKTHYLALLQGLIPTLARIIIHKQCSVIAAKVEILGVL